jgi:hypothetical protein
MRRKMVFLDAAAIVEEGERDCETDTRHGAYSFPRLKVRERGVKAHDGAESSITLPSAGVAIKRCPKLVQADEERK